MTNSRANNLQVQICIIFWRPQQGFTFFSNIYYCSCQAIYDQNCFFSSTSQHSL